MTLGEAVQALKTTLLGTPGVLGVAGGNFGGPQLVVYTNAAVGGLPANSNGFTVRQQQIRWP